MQQWDGVHGTVQYVSFPWHPEPRLLAALCLHERTTSVRLACFRLLHSLLDGYASNHRCHRDFCTSLVVLYSASPSGVGGDLAQVNRFVRLSAVKDLSTFNQTLALAVLAPSGRAAARAGTVTTRRARARLDS
jgi:hypothetical protein